MISISLCMIVKNEERVLARCLDSLCGLMDEIIIVDTGSTDSTMDIARRYTDKIYTFPWHDDFSAARNFSFSKATKEYIYVADADEVLDRENQNKFMQLKEALLPEIEIVQMLYCNQMQYNTTYNFDREYRPKMYKRVRQFQWVDPIHESVEIEPVIYDSEVAVFHLPENNHAPRDFANFKKQIAKGVFLSKKLHNMYARELMIAGSERDFYDAEIFFLSSITDDRRGLDEVKECAVVLAHIYRLQKNVVSFFKYVMKDVVTEPSSEACYELGAFYQERKDYEEACNWYINAMEHATPVLNIRYQEELPKQALSECYQVLLAKAKDEGKWELAKQYEAAGASLME